MTVLPFCKPYRPDPRNGEVWALENFQVTYVDGVEVQTSAGFDVIHMGTNGDHFSYLGTFDTMAKAQAHAVVEAHRLNAVL